MEPPVKRRRLGEPLEEWDGAEVDDEWEDYDGDDDTETAPVEQGRQQQLRCAEQVYEPQHAVQKACADTRFQNTMAQSFDNRSDRNFEGTGDDIDPAIDGIVINNGHIKNMRHEVAVGMPGEGIHREEQDLDDDDGDGERDGHSQDDDEDDDEDEDEDGDGDGDEEGDVLDDDCEDEEDDALLRDSTDHEMPDAGHQNVNGNYDKSTAAIENQPWTTEVDDTDVMPDYMQLHGPYPDPDSVDSIPGYSHELAVDDGHGPGLISGLYDGGGLRYASSVGPYGASPFALGPWEMLPQFQEAYGVPNLNGLTPVRAADYRYREHPPVRTLAGLTSPKSNDKRPKSMQHAAAHSSKNDDGELAGQSANLFEQHPEEASAYFADDKQAVSPGGAGRGVYAKSSIRHTKAWHAAIVEDSDTVEDPVFSAEEVDASSQTGDDFLPSNPAHKPKTSNSVVPDSRDNAIPAVAATARASYNKPSHQDFDLACMLSDDETPLFTLPSGATAGNNNFKKVARSVAKSSSVGASGVSSDDAAARGRSGRSRKRPRSDGRSRNPDSRLPKGQKSRPVASTQNSSGTRIIPPQPTPFVPYNSNIPSTSAAANESEAESASRKKRGRPRKSEISQQQAQQQQAQQQQAQQQQAQQQQAQQQQAQQQQAQQQQAHQPFMPYQPQMFGQPYYFPPFQFGFQPQAYYPFQPMIQQPFQPYPAPMAYQPLQSPFFPQPAMQLQHQLLHRPMHPLLQQLPAQRPLAPTGENAQQPVKRKRGRPRKYPVGYKRCRRKVQATNNMTALMGNRLPATEDAWYGVARRLAQDIYSLQGGYLFSNGFQVQTQAYEPVRKGPDAPPPETEYSVESSESSESSSDSELEEDDAGRITEVLDTADDGMSPEPVSGNTSRIDGPGNLESLGDSAGPEDLDSPGGSESSQIPEIPEIPGGAGDPESPGVSEMAEISESPGGLGGLESPAGREVPESTENPEVPEVPASPGSPESSVSFASNDDAGFIEILESPKSDARSVGPTPPPPNPPLSARRSSPSMREKHVAATPTPARTIGSRTSTPSKAPKSRTPVSHKSDAFGLPSSPLSTKKRSDMSLIASHEQGMISLEPVEDQPEPGEENAVVESAHTEVPDSEEEEELVLPVDDDDDDDMPIVVPEDTHIQQAESTAELQSLPSNNTTTARSPSTPLAAVKSAAPVTKTPRTPKSKTSSLAYTSRKLFQSRSPIQVANAAESLDHPLKKVDEDSLSGVRTRAASPSLFVLSPMQPAPQTPDKSKMQPAPAVTPRKSPVSRAAMVPRSVERCTPIFLDVKRAPPKVPSVTEKRPTGEVKQAITAPRTKIQEAKPQARESDLQRVKQLSLKSMFARSASEKPTGQKEHTRHPPSFPTAEARRSSSLHVQGTKSFVTSKSSKSYTADFDTARDKKRQKSRRSLLSLVSSRSKGQEAEDDEDDLVSPIRSKSSSSRSVQSFAAGKTAGAADSARHKMRKSTSRTTEEDQVQLERETTRDPDRMKDKKKKKKRRHTDGLVSRHSGSAKSADASAVQECGVDGYTCNRDFCFTCL
ncbi:hypothetical protein E4U55_007990 [Claviceps digitariae]|nr:hypothetical protein E4U55_007990 [Claviceps digitariae]